jgi:protein SERAC1
VIFIAHSLGGLVCANALSRQHGTDEASKNLTNRTRGIIFLGTPFAGSEKARWGKLALRYLSYISSINDEKVEVLQERSMKLVAINDAFAKYIKARDRSGPWLEISCYFEEYPTKIRGSNVGIIVEKSSAVLPGVLGLSIQDHHADMTKFEDEYRHGFISISNILIGWMKDLELEPDDENKKPVCSF